PRPRNPDPETIAIVAFAPKLRMTRRRLSKAPARVAASRSVGSGAAACSRRTFGQAAGVLRRVVIAQARAGLPGEAGRAAARARLLPLPVRAASKAAR